MSTVVKENGKFRAYAKGSFENVIQKCIKVISTNGSLNTLNMKWKLQIEEYISDMIKNGQKLIALAYKDIDSMDVPPGSNLEDLIQSDLVLIGIFGLEIRIKADIRETIKQLKESGIIVRFITEENTEVAKVMAKTIGVVTEEELNYGIRNLVMDGADLEEITGGLENNKIKRIYEFNNAVANMRVLSKASRLHKLILAIGLSSDIKNSVMITGNEVTDQELFIKSVIGLTNKENSTDVVKESASVIMTNSNLSDILSGIKWGRNVFQGISKFLQFQIIGNVSAIIVACLGCAFFGESPLSPIHLLWINIITNIFSSICLPVDSPSDNTLKFKPYTPLKPLISKTMWKCIIIISSYQILIMTLIMLFGGLFITYSTDETITDDNWFTKNKKINTIIFNTYVYCLFFTLFCCRTIKSYGISYPNHRI